MNQLESSSADAWNACSPGTLHQLSRRIRGVLRRKTVLGVAAPLAMIAVVALGAWSAYQATTPSEFNYGGVTCQQVQANIQRYAMHQLPPEAQRAFAVHLANCPHCQGKMRSMQRDETPVGAAADGSTANTVAESFPPTWRREENSSEGVTLHGSLIASGLN